MYVVTADIEGMVLLAVDPGGATGPFHFQQDHLIISSLSLEGNGSGTAGCFKAVTSAAVLLNTVSFYQGWPSI